MHCVTRMCLTEARLSSLRLSGALEGPHFLLRQLKAAHEATEARRKALAAALCSLDLLGLQVGQPKAAVLERSSQSPSVLMSKSIHHLYSFKYVFIIRLY